MPGFAPVRAWVQRAWRVVAIAPRRIWLMLAGLAVGYALVCLVAPWLGALALEMAGLTMVAHGVHKTRKEFGEPSLQEHLREWARALGRLGRGPQRIESRGRASVVARAIGNPTFSATDTQRDRSVEDRVVALEQDLEAHKKSTSERFQGVDQRAEDLRQQIERERADRHKRDKELSDQLKTFAVGGIYLEMVGLVWLLFGVTLGTLPDRFLAFLPCP